MENFRAIYNKLVLCYDSIEANNEDSEESMKYYIGFLKYLKKVRPILKYLVADYDPVFETIDNVDIDDKDSVKRSFYYVLETFTMMKNYVISVEEFFTNKWAFDCNSDMLNSMNTDFEKATRGG